MTSDCSAKFHYNPTVTLRMHQGVSFHQYDTCIGNTVSIDLSHAFLIYSMDHSWLRWGIATANLKDKLIENVTSKVKLSRNAIYKTMISSVQTKPKISGDTGYLLTRAWPNNTPHYNVRRPGVPIISRSQRHIDRKRD